jgi:hypothetical protein
MGESLLVKLKVRMVIADKWVEAGRVLPLAMIPQNLRTGRYVSPVSQEEYPSTPIVFYDEQ